MPGHQGHYQASRPREWPEIRHVSVVDVKGKPVPPGHGFTPDTVTDSFHLVIHSSDGVSADRIKEVIQREFKVTHVCHPARRIVKRPG